MSFRVLSRDEADVRADIRPLDPEMEISESPRRSAGTGHSRHQSESRQLLPDPNNLFEYSTTTHFRFPDADRQAPNSRQSDPRFPNWSFDPQSLRRSRRQWWRDFILDILMMAIGLPFFALAGTVIRVNGRVTGKHELNVLEQCIRGAATLFPLIFSVVVGRALVKLASWKLERGAALGLLERLMGSRTVGGTISTQFRLHSLSLVAIALIFLWLLSPLGSQAVLRILSTGTNPITAPANVTYVNTRQPNYSGDTAFTDSWFSGFASLFSASLVASPEVKNGSMDVWGNVKIPYFSSLDRIPEDSDGWRQLPQNSTNSTIYSSLFGIPLSGLPTGNTTFSIESTYLELSCQNITSNTTRNGSDFYNSGLITTNGPFKSAQNVTAQTPWAIGYLGTDVTALLPPELYSDPKCLDCLPDNVTSMIWFPSLLLYQDLSGARNVTSIYCTPSQAYVESTITCSASPIGRTCAVTAQRLSTLPHVPTELTSLSFAQTLTGLTALLPNSTQQISHIDLLQNYLARPDDTTFIQSTPWPAFSPSSNTSDNESRFLTTPLADFGARLGQVINTFLFGSFPNSTEFLTHALPLPVNDLGNANPQTNLLSSIQNLTATFTVPANITSNQSIYICNYSWLGLFVGSSLAIPLAALAAAILGRLTKARDYLGYVSSVVRESQHAGIPKGGVNMDGLERTRGLRNVRVRLGDVGDIERGVEIGTGVALTVGQLAIGEEGSTRGIGKGKLYI